jgi:hypothetical protein
MVKTTASINYQGEPNSRPIAPFEMYFNQFAFSGIMLFEHANSIDLDKLKTAFEKSVKHFDFLFYRTKDSKFSQDEQSKVILQTLTTTSPLADMTEKLVPIANQQGQLSFQFTQGKNEFALGYVGNHAMLDQSGLLAFISSLTHFYHDTNYQPKPIKALSPHIALTTEEKQRWLDKSFCVDIARQHDRIQKLSNDLAAYKKPSENQQQFTVKLSIPKKQLKLIQMAWSDDQTRISSNDIINALLVYLAAHDQTLRQFGPLECQFAMNVRPALGLNENDIGNYLTMISIGEDKLLALAENKNLHGIAKCIKQHVKQINPERFYDLINWYATLADRQESQDDYISRFMQNPAMTQTTNWTSFDYSTVALDNAKFIGLAQPPSDFKRPYLCPIMQTTKDGEVNYICEFTTFTDITATLDELNQTIFNGILQY